MSNMQVRMLWQRAVTERCFPKQRWKVDFITEDVRMTLFGEIIKTIVQILPSQSD